MFICNANMNKEKYIRPKKKIQALYKSLVQIIVRDIV